MRAVLIIGLCFTWLSSTAQTALPNVILDSMIFEVKRGRQCELVIKSQADELQKQGQELAHTNKALSLSQSESKTLSNLLSNAKESQNLDFQSFAIEKAKLKRKIRKRNLLIVVETIGLVGLILLL